MKLFKKAEKENKKVIFSPVYVSELLGAMYQEGEILAHARIHILIQKPNALVGIAYHGSESSFFVASHPNVIKHIEQQGGVPLIASQFLRFFKDKKRMNAHLSIVSVA